VILKQLKQWILKMEVNKMKRILEISNFNVGIPWLVMGFCLGWLLHVWLGV